jgi:hypothetical protein
MWSARIRKRYGDPDFNQGYRAERQRTLAIKLSDPGKMIKQKQALKRQHKKTGPGPFSAR